MLFEQYRKRRKKRRQRKKVVDFGKQLLREFLQ